MASQPIILRFTHQNPDFKRELQSFLRKMAEESDFQDFIKISDAKRAFRRAVEEARDEYHRSHTRIQPMNYIQLGIANGDSDSFNIDAALATEPFPISSEGEGNGYNEGNIYTNGAGNSNGEVYGEVYGSITSKIYLRESYNNGFSLPTGEGFGYGPNDGGSQTSSKFKPKPSPKPLIPGFNL